MAGICTSAVRDSGGDCNHLHLAVDLDGEPITIPTGANDPLWDVPLSAEEKQTLLRLLARWWKGKGGDLAAFAGRVLAGEEATNVKAYTLFGPGLTIVKTNVGTAYVNALPGANGEPTLVDCTGCTEFRPVLNANLVTTGPFGFRIVRQDNAVFYENATVALTGEQQLDPGWQAIPAGFTGLEVLRLQVKSAVASDDPLLRRCLVLVR